MCVHGDLFGHLRCVKVVTVDDGTNMTQIVIADNKRLVAIRQEFQVGTVPVNIKRH